MEVMMTGGDIDINEDTLTQVVNMLQSEGQIKSNGNHTIILKTAQSNEVHMVKNCHY